METKKLPLVVVEDHNEVLPHIYRGIGAKRLPFSQLTMIHFDSHPDLLIPAQMMADDTFNKNVLFEAISIENWIIPAVYAGHIDHVIWIKPPWCQQMKDTHTKCYVGKCVETGYIRVSSHENYFLSEALYADEETLINKKLFHLSVCTLKPRLWESLPPSGEVITLETSDSKFKLNQTLPLLDDQSSEVEFVAKSRAKSSDLLHVTESDGLHKETSVRGGNSPREMCPGEAVCASSSTDCCTKMSASTDCVLEEKPQESLTNKKNVTLKHPTNDVSDLKMNVPSKRPKLLPEQTEVFDSKEVEHSGKPVSRSEVKSQRGLISEINDQGGPKSEMQVNQELGHKCDASGECEGETDPSQLSQRCCLFLRDLRDSLTKFVQGKQFILDIDLDFFSTLNPFKTMLTDFQYRTLQKLYRFTPPSSSVKQDISECLQRRQEQLAQLKLAIVNRNPELAAENRDLLADLLVDLERWGEDSGRAVDLELIHEAGCTCDDTELPHHKSSDEQIQHLMTCVEHLLSYLPLPQMITVARSSQDDYCPPDQVDFIEELLLETLHNVYDNLSVTKDYAIADESGACGSGVTN